jgi:hypothetical protein
MSNNNSISLNNNVHESLRIVINVDKTPEEVYEAINNVRGWCTGCIVGATTKVGDVWVYCYPNIHFTKLKVTQLVPDKKVVWHVLDSYIDVDGDKEEWTGTDIIFDINKTSKGAKVTFTHFGLVPSFVCYEGCKEGWSFYINESLSSFISIGKGDPGTTIKISE